MAEPWDSMRALFPDNTEGQIGADDMRAQVDALETNDADNVKGASAQVIVKNPDDTLDIAQEIVTITDATSVKRYTITLNSGQYTTTPVTMKPYVYIKGEPGVVVTANNGADTIFTMSDETRLTNITVDGAVTGVGISFTSAGQCYTDGIFLEDCDTGLHVDTVGGMDCHGLILKGTGTTGVDVRSGTVTIYNAEIEGESTYTTFLSFIDTAFATVNAPLSLSPNVTNALVCGGTSAVLFNNPGVLGATNGITVTGDTNITVKGGEFFQCDVGFNIPVDVGSPKVEFSGSSATDSTLFDIAILNTNATVLGLGSADLSNSAIVEGVSATGLVVDLTDGDRGCQVFGELKVGTPLQPSESCFGEGDSYASLLTARMYTYDGGTWVDVTTALSSPTGSTATFPDTLVDTSIYVASLLSRDGDYLKIPGFKVLETVAATHAGTGSPFVTEYWDGSDWVEVTTMTTDSYDEYLSHGSAIFEEVGAHQVRFDGYLPTATWVASDPMNIGTLLYWIRIRIVSQLTVAPVMQQIKLHSNRAEINDDGYFEFFGKSRPFKSLPWDSGLLTATGNNPVGAQLYVSDTLDRLLVGNLFPNLTAESVGFNTYVPFDTDTSTPIRLRFSFTSDTGESTDAVFTIRWGWTYDGDRVYDAPPGVANATEQSLTMTVPMPSVASTQVSKSELLDISEIIPGGDGAVLWVSVERPTGDDHSGDVALINIRPLYTSHVLGGHI